jgi:carbonic anhydrase
LNLFDKLVISNIIKRGEIMRFNRWTGLAIALFVTSCSSKKNEEVKSPKAAPEAAVEVAKVSPPEIGGHNVPSPSTEAHSSGHGAPAAAAHASSGHHDSGGGVSAEQSLGWLMNGNTRFMKNHVRNDFKKIQAKQKRLGELSKGQKPHAIVLSCSDSRVPPEIVFDQNLGEIFVVRVAGEALDSSVIASVEYAAEHLGSNLIVVLGHESCGAVKAAISMQEGKSSGSPSLDRLVADIRPRIEKTMRTPVVNDTLVESWANARGVAKDLLSRSEIIRAKVKGGNLKIVSALYHLGTGLVSFE